MSERDREDESRWKEGAPWALAKAHPVAAAAIVLPTLLLLVLGFRLCFFHTDDAFIAFRYVSNAIAGRGLVWNPPPFRPVEGYTSFLWVVLLWASWRAFGVAPMRAADALSLASGVATLLLTCAFLARLRLPREDARARFGLVAVGAVGLVTNRSFLTWLSSGLETSLFDFLLLWWVYEATAPDEARHGRWLTRLAASAALAALTRPEGLLAVAATCAIVPFAIGRSPVRAPRAWLAAAPLVAPALHILWRRSHYGLWLPLTYYAKVGQMWPEAGVRYAASFVVEDGLWVWIVLLLIHASAERLRGARHHAVDRGSAPRIVAVVVILFYVIFYVVVVGGDHFEYRIFVPLVPLSLVTGAWLVVRITRRRAVQVAALAVLVLASYPIAWTHFFASRAVVGRKQTHKLFVPIAERFPAPVRAPLRAWDEWQGWLIGHYVCLRQHEHATFVESQTANLPSRAVGEAVDWASRDVLAARAVGVVGWVLPNTAILDTAGLNDRVVAMHSPLLLDDDDRRMAHEREPPPGYVECFKPNVRLEAGRYLAEPRPLGDDEIAACEAWRR